MHDNVYFNVLIQRKHRKTSFLKETLENADLHKVVPKKTMTTQEIRFRGSFKCLLFTNERIFSYRNCKATEKNKSAKVFNI